MEKYILTSEQDTITLAKQLAAKTGKGNVFALHGELGAGKTFFARHFCHALDIDDEANSPSYVLLNIYHSRRLDCPVYHLDLYRLAGEEEVLELGIHDFLEDGVTLIEWAEKAKAFLPDSTVHIRFSLIDGQREAQIFRRE